MTKKTGQRAAEPKRVRVAVAQSAPVYLDKRASLTKALESRPAQAAKRDAWLVAFGETWLPGYPAWLDGVRAFKEIDHEAMALDVSGHYARPDLFRFEKKELV